MGGPSRSSASDISSNKGGRSARKCPFAAAHCIYGGMVRPEQVKVAAIQTLEASKTTTKKMREFSCRLPVIIAASSPNFLV